MMGFLIVLIIILCVALAFFVLIQNPKGGGLTPGAGGAGNMFGVQRTTDVLEKGTWTLLGLITVLTLVSTIIGTRSTTSAVDSKIRKQIENTAQPMPQGNMLPGNAPATGKPAANTQQVPATAPTGTTPPAN